MYKLKYIKLKESINNWFLKRLSFEDYGQVIPYHYPLIAPIADDIQFALSNNCNFRCKYCLEHSWSEEKNDFVQSDKILEALHLTLPHLKEAAFHHNSEFFIDPNFEKILGVCSKYKVAVSLNTNGSYLPPSHIQALEKLRSQLNITISIDATEPKTFFYLKNYSLEKVLNNSKIMIDIIERKKKKLKITTRTYSQANFVIMRSNLNQVIPFFHMAFKMKFDQVSYLRLIHCEHLHSPRNVNFDYKNEGPWNFKNEYNEVIENLTKISKRYDILCRLPPIY